MLISSVVIDNDIFCEDIDNYKYFNPSPIFYVVLEFSLTRLNAIG